MLRRNRPERFDLPLHGQPMAVPAQRPRTHREPDRLSTRSPSEPTRIQYARVWLGGEHHGWVAWPARQARRMRASPRIDSAELDLARAYEPCEPLETTIIGALHVIWETAGRQLSHAQMISQAFATNALLLAARIAAVAESCIAGLLAFHCPGLIRVRCNVNSD